MKSEKKALENLRIQSFITATSFESEKNIKGGSAASESDIIDAITDWVFTPLVTTDCQ